MPKPFIHRVDSSAPGMATVKQCNFLMILCNDCGYGDMVTRRDFVSRRVGRAVKYFDELTIREAQGLISELLEVRTEKQEEERRGDAGDESY